MQEVQVVIYEGFDELDAVAPFEILAGAGLEARLVTLDRPRTVTSRHGMTVEAHGALADVPELLVVPGGGWISRSGRGAWAEVRTGELPAAIADRHAAGAVVAGVCTGVMLLAASGILRGRPAVTHRRALDDLREFGADVHPDARVVDDGDVLTAGGVTSAIDLALHLVARERGDAVAADAARRLEYERQGEVRR